MYERALVSLERKDWAGAGRMLEHIQDIQQVISMWLIY
jgi:hypothetical protein